MRRRSKLGKGVVAAFSAAAVWPLASPTLVMAQEAESESAGGISLLIPNMAEFVPMIIAFVVMWLVFAKVVYPVIIGMIDKRANMIKENLEQAEESKIRSARLLEEREQMLEDAKLEAADIIASARNTAEATRARIEAEAHAQAQAIIDRAHQTAEAEKASVALELQRSVAEISVMVAGRLVGEDLSDDQHRKIIERYVEEAGSLNGGR